MVEGELRHIIEQLAAQDAGFHASVKTSLARGHSRSPKMRPLYKR